MKKYILIAVTVSLTLISILTSCENKLEFDFRTKDAKLVINALLNSDSISNEVFVSYSGIYGATPASDAIVKVYINGVLKETVDQAEENKNDFGARYPIHCKFLVNDLVKIEVSTKDNTKHAWAEAKVLPPTSIDKIEVSPKEYPSSILGYKKHLQFKITINDHSQGKDYYYRLVPESYNRSNWQESKDGSKDKGDLQLVKHICMYIDNDYVLMNGNPTAGNDNQDTFVSGAYNNYGIFSNKFFKDKSYTLNISIPIFNELNYVVIRLLRISEAEYKYMQALNTIDSDILADDCSEPVIFDTNVNGGLGIVSISSESSQKFQVMTPKE